jgi:hypothetical protein
MTLTREEAEWLIGFVRGLPGTAPAVADPGWQGGEADWGSEAAGWDPGTPDGAMFHPAFAQDDGTWEVPG